VTSQKLQKHPKAPPRTPVKSLFTKYLSPVIALATLTMGAMLLSACGASVTEQAALPGTVTAVVSPSRVVAGQIYTYKADSASGSTITWSWGDGSPDTVGNTVQKVWNKAGNFTTTLSAGAGGSAASIKQATVVAGEPVSAGEIHTCALQPSGTVLCWGDNSRGQLGDGTITSRTATTAVTGLTDATAISAGYSHNCALKRNGSVVCWGSNYSGQLGDGTLADKTTPVLVAGLTDAVAITTGLGHSCAIKADASVVCWGSNSRGQLGNTTLGGNLIPTPVNGLTDAIALSAGILHTCALKTNGSVVCWGANSLGQLGDSTAIDNGKPVLVVGLTDATVLRAGAYSNCAIKVNGGVVCWGYNNRGQLGNGTQGGIETTPVVVTGLTDVIGLSGGKVENASEFDPSPKLRISGGHSCAVKANGSIACWGDNRFGQLGDGSDQLINGPITNSNANPVTLLGQTDAVAISAGGIHTCALKSNGSLACWGSDANGELGDGNSGSPQNSLVAVVAPSGSTGLLSDILEINSGYRYTCALKNDGQVLCWGDGQLTGLDDPNVTATLQVNPTPTAVVGLGTDTKQISTGGFHACALKTAGQVMCWGNNLFGELGNPAVPLGYQTNPTPTAVVGLGTDTKQISAATLHTCALKTDGKVMCWGINQYGQLGSAVPVGVQANPTPTVVVDLGTDTKQISAGNYHTCALKTDGKVMCWGNSQYGQEGSAGPVGAQANPTPTVIVDLGTDIKQINAINNHTCALKTDGKVLCWGLNQYGNPDLSLVPGAFTPTPTLAIDLGINAKHISGGNNHTCALKTDSTVLCWGYNQFGQLGNPAVAVGAQVNPVPVQVVGLDSAKIQQISAGYTQSCALKTNGKVLCWGNNQYGQLGASGNPPAFVDLGIKPEPTPVLGGSIFWR
jgi:alpha-tubulin suppressor-like RCC1 family protein